MELHKVCNEETVRFGQKPPKDLLRRSQEAGRIVLESLAFTNLRFEAQGRVDVIATYPDGIEWRIELKLISLILEMKSLVLRALRQTKARMGRKRLTHLLVITMVRHKVSDDEHFIKAKQYCLLGIFVSKSELEKDEKTIASEIAEEVGKYLDPDVDLVSVSKAEYLEMLRLEDERLQLMDDLQSGVKTLRDTVGGIGDKVEGIEDKVEGIEDKIEGIEDKVEGIEDKVEGIEDKVEGIVSKVAEMENNLKNQTASMQEQLSHLTELVSKIVDKLENE